MSEDWSDPFRPGVAFDPVCGLPLRGGENNPFFDGDRIYYFCSPQCRKTFVEERSPRRPARSREVEGILPDPALTV